MTRSPTWSSLSSLAAVALLVLATGCENPSTIDGVNVAATVPSRGLRAVDSTRIRARTSFLASDLLEGRAPGSRGGELAAEYIASEMAGIGLEPAADGGYRQRVPILALEPDPTLQFTSADGRSSFQPAYLEDFVAWTGRQQEEVEFSGDVVFVGYGISAPASDWDDYAGTDVTGRILLGLVNDPGSAGVPGFRGDTLTYFGRWTYKYEEAARQGAEGLILVHTPSSAGYGWSVVRNSWSGPQFELPREEGEPSLSVEAWVSRGGARRLLGLAGLDLNSLIAAARRPGFTARELPLRAEGEIRSRIERMETPNVVGLLPGSDSARRDEVLVFTSHYDHLGIGPPQNGDSIYNGAADNASGIAVLLDVAEAFAGLPEAPARSLLFAAVTAEESGLLGSEYLAENPPFGHFVANINVDGVNMYGRTEDMVQIGGEHSTLGSTFGRVASYLDLRPAGDHAPEQGYFFRSDQFSFARAGVPALYIDPGVDYVGEPEGTGESRTADYRERRYHQPDDELLPEHTMGGAAQQAQTAFLVGWVTAAAADPPAWNQGSPFATSGEAGEGGGR